MRAARYAGMAVIALLVTAWLAVASYAWLGLSETAELSESIGRTTEVLRQELEREPTLELAAEHAFPQGRAVEVAKATWSAGVPISAYPLELLGQVMPAERPRAR